MRSAPADPPGGGTSQAACTPPCPGPPPPAPRSRRASLAVIAAGGRRPARPAAAAGFCVYIEAAIAIRHALDAGGGRVTYVAVGVHPGDGVELALWDGPRAVTLSVHQ